MTPDAIADLELIGGLAAGGAVVFTMLWIAVFASSPDPGDDPTDRMRLAADRGGLLVRQFLPTTLVALLYVPVWLGLAARLWPDQAAWGLLALAFGVLYVPFVTIGYWTQFTVVRGVAERARRDPSPWIPTWRVVLFDDASTSWTGSLVVFGYLVWGIAAGCAAVGLFAAGGASAIITATALAITAALSILGGIGFVARHPVLARGVLASGITSVVATGLVAVLLLS